MGPSPFWFTLPLWDSSSPVTGPCSAGLTIWRYPKHMCSPCRTAVSSHQDLTLKPFCANTALLRSHLQQGTCFRVIPWSAGSRGILPSTPSPQSHYQSQLNSFHWSVSPWCFLDMIICGMTQEHWIIFSHRAKLAETQASGRPVLSKQPSLMIDASCTGCLLSSWWIRARMLLHLSNGAWKQLTECKSHGGSYPRLSKATCLRLQGAIASCLKTKHAIAH